MTDIAAPAELPEEDAFVRALADGVVADATFCDELFSRCHDAIVQAGSGGATPLDVAVLIRQVMRRGSERDGIPFRLLLGENAGVPADPEVWRTAGVMVVPAVDGRPLIEAEPYRPAWLDAEVAVDAAAAAGTAAGRRVAQCDNLPADPFFAAATEHAAYKTPGQRAAVRAAASMPDGGTLIAELPTGSGKTEIAISLAHLGHGQTVIIVVPTVALAYDFERRFRDLYERRLGRAADDLVFAWTGDTEEDARDLMKQDLLRGNVPLLVTSPESLGGALHGTLRDMAGAGRVAALIVDEAHLVTQWGHDFRPEFRELATLRQDILTAAANGRHRPLKTVLMSATLGPAELRDLADLFSAPGPVSLVAANMLRLEPDYWIASKCPPGERETRVLEALTRLPRPLVLYVTRPDEAAKWSKLSRAHGFGRAAVVTGETAGFSRRDVLDGMRAGGGRTSRYDIVIATSAFGLGIDYPGIRAVVHACLPETVDRWYQEVGRGGRDGHASVALLVPADGDAGVAAGLGLRMLTPEMAAERWRHLWADRRRIGARSFVDLHSPPPRILRGSYNYRWNSQLLRGLQDLGQVSRRSVSPWEADALGLARSAGEHDWEEAQLLTEEKHDQDFFEREWVSRRDKAAEPMAEAFEAMKSVLKRGTSVCAVISQAYAPDDGIWDQFGVAAATLAPEPGCGRCQHCRERRVTPPSIESPHPAGSWATDMPLSSALAALLDDCPSDRRVAVLTDEEPAARVGSLAPLLWEAGVRYFAGIRDWRPANPRPWAFIDDTLDFPGQAPPVPGLVLPRPRALASDRWLVPAARARDIHGQPTPLILLIRQGARIGGRSAGTGLVTLPARTAELILKARLA
ncbi:MAG TPA: protein DpdF [Streptosporangiaceae bacterium]|nr:protein DpdF [Streptosporangiaceae bacterium]